MRKILSEKDKEKKKKRNALVLSIIMLLILVIGTAGYAFLYRSDTQKEETTAGNIKFNGSRWIIPIGGADFYFINSPESVRNISAQISFSLKDYTEKSLYLVSDNSAVNSEIASTLGKYAGRVQAACYGPCDKDLPEKDCTENLIIWRDAPVNRVYQQENCIFIEGDMTAVDAFLFKILGV